MDSSSSSSSSSSTCSFSSSSSSLSDAIRAAALAAAQELAKMDANQIEQLLYKGEKKAKKVQVVNSKGHVLAVYESQAEAARRTGISSSSISSVCLGRQAHTKGFIFRYADPEAELNHLSLKKLQEAKRLAVERGEHLDGELASSPTAEPEVKRRKRDRREMDESEDEEEDDDKEEHWLDSRPQIHQQKVEEANNTNASQTKKIQVVTSKGHVLAVYESQIEAGRRIGIYDSSISSVCLGKHAHASGFIFRFADPEAELKQLSLEELQEAKRLAVERGEEKREASSTIHASQMKKIQVVTSKGHVLAVYKSQNEAAKRTGFYSGNISDVCLGKQAHAKGFIFRFADPEAELNQLSLEKLQEAKRLAVERGEHEEEEGDEGKGKKSASQVKKVQVVTSKGHVLAVYESTGEAARRVFIISSRISDVCLGRRAQSDGFIFRYADPKAELKQLSLKELKDAKRLAVGRGEHEEEEEASVSSGKMKKVQVVTSKGQVLAVYTSLYEAARRTDINSSYISKVCFGKQAHASGFIFRFADPEAELKQLSFEELQEAKRLAVERGEHEEEEEEQTNVKKVAIQTKKIQVVNSQGRVLAVYESYGEAASRTGIKSGDISAVCLGRRTQIRGFIFRFAEPETELNQLSLRELKAKRLALEGGRGYERDSFSAETSVGTRRKRARRGKGGSEGDDEDDDEERWLDSRPQTDEQNMRFGSIISSKIKLVSR